MCKCKIQHSAFSIRHSAFQYPQKELTALWKSLLLCQFHDIIPGSSIHRVYEESGALKKDTVTIIDTVRDGQTAVELSNASLMENRDTLELEVRMTKESFNGNRFEDGCLYSEAWEYHIRFDD